MPLLAIAALNRLEPAIPTVERSVVLIDSVERGPMIRQVRGSGSLVPERIRLVAALTAGRVEQLPVRVGTSVLPGTLVVELSNPDVQLEALEAERELTESRAGLLSLETTLETQRLTQEATLATIRTEQQEANRTLALQTSLDSQGLTSIADRDRARERAHELELRTEIERQRLSTISQAFEKQLTLQHAQIERLAAIVRFHRARVASMQVRAGDEGVLQTLSLELGQWVVPGQRLAIVAQAGRLKAVLRIPETQAKDVVLGQPTAIDTHNGVISGRVARIDPGVQNGTVAVEVTFGGQLPPGARADLSVDGTIEIERLPDVLHVGRPASGEPGTTVNLFKVDPDGGGAARVRVQLGRSSLSAVEVLRGLSAGDKVILSDLSAIDIERIRLR